MRKYSVIVPVFNRPVEVRDLLQSLSRQTYKDFEVLILEDGSTETCKHVCEEYSKEIDIRYFYKENSGQGFSRNYGFERATGEYLIQFDSDAVIPPAYFDMVERNLKVNDWDAFGGPDASAPNFTPIQKAISYAMTSIFTTGGIRGKKNNLGGQFHPRSFNFGLSKQVYETVGGYKITRMGEDIEYSIRIIENGFKVGLIPEAYVYHKRRTTIEQFFKQLHFFGRARINIGRFYPSQLKLVHYFPLAFTCFIFSIPVLLLLNAALGGIALIFLMLYLMLILVESSIKNNSVKIGLLSVVTCITQLTGYGIGFASELLKNKKS
ncbi:MAG: glycosyltransferase involved in cell wall biosynthesis [Spirosomataceae bacterium]|jgi:glycosyltransferase involved in cell wall biosynthesis